MDPADDIPVIDNPYNPGIFLIRDTRHMNEDPGDPGTFIPSQAVFEDVRDTGTYLVGVQ